MLDVGAVSYYADRHLIDTGGLTDKAIAEIMHDGHGVYHGHLFFPDDATAERIVENVLARKPSYIALLLAGDSPGQADLAATPGLYPQDTALFRNQRFRREYGFVCSLPEGQGSAYNVFARFDVPPRGSTTKDDTGVLRCATAAEWKAATSRE